ncbi:MAG: hypothetical protein AAF218_02470, partial [Pseudomonadota bacterium]
MPRIQQMSVIALIFLLPYCVAYPWVSLDWPLKMAFLDPDIWPNHRWVAPDAPDILVTRVVYFAAWLPCAIAGQAALIIAALIAHDFYRGRVFDSRVAQRIYWVGACTAASAGFAIAAGCVSPMIVSWHNPDGPLPLRLWYTVNHIGLIFCGLAFMVLGAVLREAIRIEIENREF